MHTAPASSAFSAPRAWAGAAEGEALGQELAQLRQRVRQLEQAQAELEAFTAAVSHDLRTPLSAIDGFCSLIEDELRTQPGEAAERCARYADRARAGLAQMALLIDALLQLSRAGQAAVRAESVNLSALALEVLDGLKSREPARAHALSVQPGLHAWGDRALLRLLLENLLGNAWKFSAACAQVQIEFGRQTAAEGGRFFVRDRGAGFDMARAARLFQPFERLHVPSEFAGTGIGLATVRRIVGRHGGQVHAQASPGAGATFFFTLGEAGAAPAQAPF